MKTKIFIALGILVFLYIRKKKNDKKDKKVEAELKENELSTEKTVDIIRYKLDEYIRGEFPFLDDERVRNIVMGITSNLKEYELPALPEIVHFPEDDENPESYE